MTVNNELERMREEAAQFGRTEENNKRSQKGYPVSQPKSE
jgi:hypothetical protein